MRKITKIIVHCSDSDIASHDDISVIDSWHRQRGWEGVGYHYFIKGDGVLQYGRPVGDIGAHVAGHNSDSIGICFHGKNKFHPAQFGTLRTLLSSLKVALGVDKVFPHNYFDKSKTCPNFDLHAVLGEQNWVETNTYYPNALKYLIK